MTIRTYFMRSDSGLREDDLSAEIIDIALSMKTMDGLAAALNYLDNNFIDDDVAQRILYGDGNERRKTDAGAVRQMQRSRYALRC